jgi:hypothetical protein
MENNRKVDTQVMVGKKPRKESAPKKDTTAPGTQGEY